MRFLRVALTVVLLCVFASVAVAQTDATTQKMIDEVVQKTQNIKSYKVDMSMESDMMGQKALTTGQMSFKKPNKMHMTTTTEMMGGMKQEIYAMGDIVWTYMPLMNMATKIDLSKVKDQMPQYGNGIGGSADITNPFEGLPEGMVKFLGKKTVDGKDVVAFEVTTPFSSQMPAGQQGSQGMPSKINILMLAENGLPYQILAYGENDAVVMKQTYSNFRTNIPIDDSEFMFTPPEGVQVMDMTQGAMNMMKQMKGGHQ